METIPETRNRNPKTLNSLNPKPKPPPKKNNEAMNPKPNSHSKEKTSVQTRAPSAQAASAGADRGFSQAGGGKHGWGFV